MTMKKNSLQAKALRAERMPAIGQYAPGEYIGDCDICHCEYMGDKRSRHCHQCAKDMSREPAPAPKAMNIVEDIKLCVLMGQSLGVNCHYVVLTSDMLKEFCEVSGQPYEPDGQGRMHVGQFLFSINEDVDKAYVMPNPQCDVALPDNQSNPAKPT